MKDKILYLILGILIGAVITSGAFLIYSKHTMYNRKDMRPNFNNMGEEFRNQRPEDMKIPGDGNFVENQN